MIKKTYLAIAGALLGSTVIPAFADNQTMTVPIEMVSVSHGSYQPAVTISVAGGPQTSVLLDTGSVGLHIFANQVGNQNITLTNHHVINGYGSGVTYDGVLAYAPITINGVTTKVIPIVVVQKAYCAKDKPTCPVAHDDPNNPKPTGDMYGVMGVSMQTQKTKGYAAGTVYSPLRALPGNYANGFIIENASTEGGDLVIGLTPNNTSGFNKVQLTQMGKYPDDGSPVYNDKGVTAHYRIGNLERDFQTAFDSGGNAEIHFFSSSDLGLPVNKNKMVKPGLHFSASIPNAFDWEFVTGKTPGENLVGIKPALAGKPTYINLGITVFFNFDIMYDVQNGYLGFRPHS